MKIKNLYFFIFLLFSYKQILTGRKNQNNMLDIEKTFEQNL